MPPPILLPALEAEHLLAQPDDVRAVRAHIVAIVEVASRLPRDEILHQDAVALTGLVKLRMKIAAPRLAHVAWALRRGHRAVLTGDEIARLGHHPAEQEAGI